MRQKIKSIHLLLLLLLMAIGTVTLAQTSPSFDLSWHVIGGGGGESASASYQLNGTIGQSVASPPTASSASFALSSGFWAADSGMRVYLPAIKK